MLIFVNTTGKTITLNAKASDTIDKLKAESKDPQVQRIVGTSGDVGKGLGFDND